LGRKAPRGYSVTGFQGVGVEGSVVGVVDVWVEDAAPLVEESASSIVAGAER
jgi:hypothetical protein